jgi:transposase
MIPTLNDVCKNIEMAGKTKSMSIIKQLLLQLHQGQSKKQIVRDTGISKNTLRRYLRLLNGCGHPLEQLIQMDEPEIERILNKKISVNKDHQCDLEALFPWVKEELKRTGVTRFILWGEYRKRYPEGYSYSQFCWYYQQWLNAQDPSMVINHIPGDKIYVDFAGKKLKYHDLQNNQEIQVEFYAGLLGYSQLAFACAVPTQCSEDFLHATRRMLEYFGGTTQAIVTDNLKSGVTRSSIYEPEIAQSFSDFCNHYQMAAIPARARKPKDKPLVEGLIRILYSRIYAVLRNRTFYSLNDINQAISELLEVHNDTPFSRLDLSRRQVFEREEKSLLKPLPPVAFDLKFYRKATVQKNSYVLLWQDKHYYSVPMRFIGKQVTIIYTSEQVNIFFESQLVAYHNRDRRKYKYTTIPDHLPSSHRYMLGLTPDFFINWANDISPEVSLYIRKLLLSKSHPEQAYKSCQGIQSLTRKLGKEKLIQACQMALALEVYNYMFIKNIMEKNQEVHQHKIPTLPLHENIRGAHAYQ